MATINGKKIKNLIKHLTEMLGRQPSPKELLLATQGYMPKKG